MCKENFHLLFSQFSPMTTSDITIVHHQIHETRVSIILSTKLQTLFGFHQFFTCTFFGEGGCAQIYEFYNMYGFV